MVIIDAGHGGADKGGGSNQYWLEKDLALKISLYQYKRLKELNVPVSLTRSTDITLTPQERVQKVFSLSTGNKDLLISNHVNVDFGKYDGAEVIYSIKDQKTFASLIASNLKEAGQSLSSNGIYTRKNQYGNDYYYILRDTKPIEGVIVEYGFADSSGDDIYQLQNNWERLAEAVVKSVCEYLGYPYKPQKNLYSNYTVQKGDTLYLIAKKYGMSVEELKSINNLTQDTIYPNSILKVYKRGVLNSITYVVKSGDTIYSIAKLFQTSVEEIITANELDSTTIYAGETLVIPIDYELVVYTIEKGDTLYKIANLYGININLIKALNNLSSNEIYPGETLLVTSK